MQFKIGALVSLFSIFLLITSCTKDSVGEPTSEDNNMEEGTTTEVTGKIWTGPILSFSKPVDGNPTEETNQDRITEKVWLTRGNNGGQIYNVQAENSANKDGSPKGTRWAIGVLTEVSSLQFRPFRAAVGKPQNVVGKDLVMYLEEEDIYLSVKFTNWSEQKGGGFSYERSTPE